MEQENIHKKRDRIGLILYVLYVIFLASTIFVFGRLIYLEFIWEPNPKIVKYFTPKATKSVIEPKRGAIIGCDGRLLALSTPVYQLFMDCIILKDAHKNDTKDGGKKEKEWLENAKAFSAALAKETGEKSAEEYYSMITEGRREGNRYLKLGSPIDHESLLALEETALMKRGKNKSGIIIERRDSRQYPYGALARRAIGYVKDNSTTTTNNHVGIEGTYDYALHGKEGELWLKPTDNKERIQNFDSTYVKPEDGLDIRTTLDITIQDIADKALRKACEDSLYIEMGCAIIMDVKTGAIRAMVNLARDSTDNKMKESYNMAIGLSSEPGSVFKATTLMTAIEDGFIKSLDETIPTNNGLLPGYPQDTHLAGMKEISYLHGFEISSNYVFRYIAVKNYEDNPKKLLDKLYLYKLGQAFDFDLKGLKEPYIPSPDSPIWSKTSLGSIGMGYSVQETPLHILNFYNSIANKGKMMKPYLVESIEKDGKVKVKKGQSVLNAAVCSRATADTLLRAMMAVTSEGTGKRLRGAKLKVAGKTGTSFQILPAQTVKEYGKQGPYVTLDGRHVNLATFVGFFPAEDPKYSTIVSIKSYPVRGNVNGGHLPAMAIREIVDRIYTLKEDWGEELQSSGVVPEMGLAEPQPQADIKNPIVPDLKGLSLQDAIYVIEKSGLKCTYSGIGHVVSQRPGPGDKAKEGANVTIILK